MPARQRNGNVANETVDRRAVGPSVLIITKCVGIQPQKRNKPARPGELRNTDHDLDQP